MYAVVRINQLDPDRVRDAQHELDEFDQTHAAQPGYRGTLSVDLGGNRQLVVNLWESEQQAADARAALTPTVARLLNPVLTQPSQLLGAGPVHAFQLLPATPRGDN
jgi:hypothetical protein